MDSSFEAIILLIMEFLRDFFFIALLYTSDSFTIIFFNAFQKTMVIGLASSMDHLGSIAYQSFLFWNCESYLQTYSIYLSQ